MRSWFALLASVLLAIAGTSGALAQGEPDTDRPGLDYRSFDLQQPDPAMCERACAENPACKAWTFVKPGVQAPNARCWLKSGVPAPRASACCVSGVKAAQAQVLATPAVPAGTAPKTATTAGKLEGDTNRPGMDYRNFALASPDPALCERACLDDAQCKAFTYVKPGVQGASPRCWLKSAVPPPVASPCCVSGVKDAAQTATPIPIPGPQQATPIPLPGPQKPQPAGQPASQSYAPKDPAAAARRGQTDRFESNWRVAVDKVMRDANQELLQLQDTAFRQATQTMAERYKRDAAQAAAGAPVVPPGMQLAITQMAVVGPKDKASPATLMKPPVVRQVTLFGATEADRRQNEIRGGRFVEIAGENFGACGTTCGVRVEYKGNPMQGETFTKGAPVPAYSKDLLPVGGDWGKAWNDTTILARVPEIPEFPIAAVGRVVVWRGGQQSFAVNREVSVYPSLPGVARIETVPPYGDGASTTAVVAGGELLIYGTDFGDTAGKVEIVLGTPIQVVRQIEPPMSETLTKIDLTPTSSWSNTVIHARVPKLAGRFAFQTAKLQVYKGSNPTPYVQPIRFGPRMVTLWVSGAKFHDVDYGHVEQRPASVERQGPVLKVSHDPDCGISNPQGEEGNDWFFKGGKGLPPEAELVAAVIQPIDPAWTNDWETWFLLKVKDVGKGFLTSLWKGVWEVVKFIVPKWFDSKAGSYVAQVTDATKQNGSRPLYSVHWENSCYGPYDDVPIMYTATFLVFAPDWMATEP